jgi:hypothetical protein
MLGILDSLFIAFRSRQEGGRRVRVVCLSSPLFSLFLLRHLTCDGYSLKLETQLREQKDLFLTTFQRFAIVLESYLSQVCLSVASYLTSPHFVVLLLCCVVLLLCCVVLCCGCGCVVVVVVVVCCCCCCVCRPRELLLVRRTRGFIQC